MQKIKMSEYDQKTDLSSARVPFDIHCNPDSSKLNKRFVKLMLFSQDRILIQNCLNAPKLYNNNL